MNYQVIARKYRPQRFADVVGQEHVTQTLANAVTLNRIAHAYLFCGPRGTGKTTIARIFAKCLNCTSGPSVEFADDDPRCLEIAEGRSIDVLEIDGASNNGVEQVRELRETVKYAPATSRFKIYIIDEVHMLSVAAFNALLKTLEEPPPHVKFMFATTDPEKVLPTVLSRCQRFDLRRIPAALIVKHLAHIARQEKIRADEAALYAMARGADGGMRDAESTLDQLISFCGDQIVEADVLAMFGLTARSQVFELASAILAGDAEKAFRQLDDLARNGKDLGRLLSDVLNHFRNLLIYQVSQGDLELLEVTEAEAATLKSDAARVNADALGRIMEVLADGEQRLRDAVSKKILFEITLLRSIQARNAVSVDELLRALESWRADAPAALPPDSASPSPAPITPQPAPPSRPPAPPATPPPPTSQTPAEPTAGATVSDPPAPTAPPAPPAPPAQAAPLAAANDLENLWSTLLEAVGRASPFTRSYLAHAFPVSVVRQVLTIGFDPEFANYLPLVDNAKNHALLQTKLRELGWADPSVRFVQAQRSGTPTPPVGQPSPALAAPATPTPAPAATAPAIAPAQPPRPAKPKPTRLDPAEFKNDPLIKQALELYRGQIVEVRA